MSIFEDNNRYRAAGFFRLLRIVLAGLAILGILARANCQTWFQVRTTTQYICVGDSIDIQHRSVTIAGIGSEVVIGTDSENGNPLIFSGFEFVQLNDSTIVGQSFGPPMRRVEWQRREGEQAVMLATPEQGFTLEGYEFFRAFLKIRK